MSFRRLLAICSLVLIGGVLVACGSDDEDATPTSTAAPSTRITSNETSTVEPTSTETAASTSSMATPGATPATSGTPAATPVDTEGTPEQGLYAGTQEDLMQTPQIQPIRPIATAVPLQELSGTLTLDGRVQQDFTISDEGCVGLGEWRQLQPGTQVIVRDATGTAVDVAELEALTDGDTCSWSFAFSAPGSSYFSVSIPMVTEVWFDQTDAGVQAGEIELFVP